MNRATDPSYAPREGDRRAPLPQTSPSPPITPPRGWLREGFPLRLSEQPVEQSPAPGIERGRPRRLDVTGISLGDEWILVALPHEMFCQYELWVDEAAPFAHNMTLSYTNFNQGYVADDASLALGAKGGYEAGKLPLWWACGALSEFLGPPEVGAETIIKSAIASLWA